MTAFAADRGLVEFAVRDRLQAWCLRELEPTPAEIVWDTPPPGARSWGQTAIIFPPNAHGTAVRFAVWLFVEHAQRVTSAAALVNRIDVLLLAQADVVLGLYRDAAQAAGMRELL
jgi:hypothetical protein